MIEASFASQYGIRLRQEPDITYAEWARLLSGLLPETPLGKIVQIRAEKDPKAIKRFGSYEKKVRSDWAKFKAKSMPKEQADFNVKAFQETMKKLFYRG